MPVLNVEDFVEKEAPTLEPEQRESTTEDYWNTVNPIGLVYNNPKLRYDSLNDDSNILDTKSPEFRGVYDTADIQTKRAMIEARSVSHALKISDRRKIQADSQQAIDEDGLGTQLLYGAIPALASPTSFIPIAGIAGKAFQIGKQVNRAVKIGQVGAVGAVTGAISNVADEALIKAQGMEGNLLSAGLVGAGFGGVLGAIGGAISGPYGKTHAIAMSKDGDTFSQDFDIDPNIKMEVDDNGVLKIADITPNIPVYTARQGKGMTDYLPYLGSFLRSDVNTVLQSSSSVLRAEQVKIAGGTVALKDMDGNVVPTPWNATNDLKTSDGSYMKYNHQVEDSYNSFKSEGFTGSYDDFIDNVSNIYTDAAMKQEKEVFSKIQEVTKETRQKMTKEVSQAKKDFNQGAWYYKDSKGKDQPLTEELVGSISEEKLFTKKPTKKDIKKFNEEIDDKFRGILDEEIRTKVDAIYDTSPVRFEGNRYEVEAATKYKEYYADSLQKGKDVGIKELSGLSAGRLYRPRVWNFKAIKSGNIPQPEVKARLRDALEGHPNQAGLSKEQMDKAVDILYEGLSNSVFDLSHLRTSWLVSKDVPFSGLLRNRKLKVDESRLGPLLKANLQDTTGAYHYKTKGRQALAKNLGIVDADSADVYMKDLRQKLHEEGNTFTDKEFAAFERNMKDITGDLRMNQLADTPEWTWVRNLSTYNSGRLGGGFGGNQFIELASNLMFNGMSILLSGRFKASFKNAGKLLYTKTKVDDEFTKAIINSGFMETALHTHRVNRFADGEAGFNSGWLENNLNGLNDKLQKWNGMRYFTAVMEDHTGGMVLEQLSRMAKKSKLSNTELMRLARWGFSPTEAKAFAKDLDKYFKPKEGKLELDKFTKINQAKFQQAIQNGISEMVVQGDSIHLPSWMKTPGPMLKLLTQFMRFPLVAHEVLLRKGMQDEQAKLMAGILGSTFTYMGLKYVREQASIQAGMIDESDAKFDYYGGDSDEAIMRGLTGSLNYNAQLGMISNLWNHTANATGNEELGRDYASNKQLEAFLSPTFGGTAADILALTKSMADGELGSERDLMRVKSAIMFNNLPLIDEALKEMIKEVN